MSPIQLVQKLRHFNVLGKQLYSDNYLETLTLLSLPVHTKAAEVNIYLLQWIMVSGPPKSNHNNYVIAL